ncbi:MAG TPA: hypothetical protein DEB73_00750 [Candidatus Magasanikbacteria bacterium]|uniref:Uncharacterized protein n=2 Tax=Candidatus Magasanikiibacteriota TaxID=1752731 RepID=A0A0G0ZZW1_9BACT|nr:MAG: hypothetical protein UU49_C0035G0004 [Candidatus Magasanikbacteria bacterium GW2011_GWC2_41_17]KKS54217.1 MAG: hypothetical protein UV20_C0038G0007 [Candidatus Magasanikbacteria bacterium GW2011_GWA2_42_32]HBV57787.1 hypothetical protein [Candidatus Magasanikbacteria bacterium]HBX16143.1 hypothetical protein [Candidatus Magasanikbacteria bacterium]
MSNCCYNDAPGMQGCRSRNEHGPLRAKRGDTLIRTIENIYQIDLGVRNDMRWDTYKEKTGVRSINDLITGK